MIFKKRLYAFDSIRGIAAFVVAFGHFFPPSATRTPLINLFVDTKLAVAIFFILSGFVLFKSTKIDNPKNLLSYIISRFIRLSVPVFFCSITVMVFSKILPEYHKLNGEFSYWNTFNAFRQDPIYFERVIKFSFYNTLISYDTITSLIPPAWTMRPEFAGSIFIYFICYLLSKNARAKHYTHAIFTTCALLILTAGYIPALHYFSFFSVGALISINTWKINSPIYTSVLLLLMRSIQLYFGYDILFLDFIFGALLIFSVIKNEKIMKFLENKPLVYLGHISFPLYLLHFGVFMYIASGLFHFLEKYPLVFNDIGIVAVAIVTFTSLIIIASLLSYLDAFSILLSRKIKFI
jgi:peptidoglycan/LPS O-acetylase OafA/YrhL